MKRLLIISSLLLSWALSAQTPRQIRTDTSLWWAEGPDDASALSALSDIIATQVDFSSGAKTALLATYRNELRRESSSLQDGTTWLRYLRKDHLDALFRPRQRKVEELIASAEKALQGGQAGAAKTYYQWVQTYLESLPVPFQERLPGVRRALAGLDGTAPQPLRLPHIEREVNNLKALLERPVTKPVAQVPKTLAPSSAIPASAPAAPLPKRECIPSGSALYPLLPLTRQPLLPSIQATIPQEQPVPSRHWMVLLEAQINGAAGGSVALRKGNWGAYLSARSRFKSVVPAYQCLSDGTMIPDSGTVWTQGTPQVTSTVFTGGILYGVRWISLYAGAGYGTEGLYWQDLAGDWVQVQDRSFQGLTLEGGLLADIPLNSRLGLVLKAGVTSVAFKTVTPTFGLGVRFQ